MRRLAPLVPPLAAALLASTGGGAETVRCDLAGEVLVYAEPAWCDAHGGRALDRPRPRTAAPAAAPAEEPALTVREAQEMLEALGFDPGPADGVLGPRTRAALGRFTVAHGLDGDGRRLDRQMQQALRRAWREHEEAMLPAADDGFQSRPAIR